MGLFCSRHRASHFSWLSFMRSLSAHSCSVWGPCEWQHSLPVLPPQTQCHLQTYWDWLPSHHLSLRWRHQATLSLVPCPEKLYFWAGKLNFNQWPLLLEPNGPTGFQPTCSLSMQSACRSLTTENLWQILSKAILSKALLVREKITCTGLI